MLHIMRGCRAFSMPSAKDKKQAFRVIAERRPSSSFVRSDGWGRDMSLLAAGWLKYIAGIYIHCFDRSIEKRACSRLAQSLEFKTKQ